MTAENPNFNVRMIVTDPVLRKHYLGRSLDAYQRRLESCGVAEEDRKKMLGQLAETINDPNLLRRRAEIILASFADVLANPNKPTSSQNP